MQLKQVVKIIVSLVLVTYSASLQSCMKCSQEYRMVEVRVLNDTLTDSYTIRLRNSDTIRLGNNHPWYLILTDSYQDELRKSEEAFLFIGEINDTIVIHEEYVIGADKCHIHLVSGKNEIRL